MDSLIKIATPADLDSVIGLMSSAEQAPHWTRQMYLKRIEERSVLIAKVDKAIAAALVFCAHSPGEWEIENIVVETGMRKQGIGRAMIRQLGMIAKERGCARLHLEVRESNEPALALYRGSGFVETTRRSAYYSNPQEDALLFTLAL